MKYFNIIFVTITLLSLGCGDITKSDNNIYNFLGTTWVMHHVGDSYNYIWLSCGSTFISYDDEIENHYYGRFIIENDTLILIQEFEDDYHKFGNYPIKRNSYSKNEYLIRSDKTIELIRINGKHTQFNNIYTLKQQFDCESLVYK